MNKIRYKMKKTLTTIIMLLLTVVLYAQQTASVYVPMRTYHWDRSDEFLNSLDNTEGGNFGAVFIFRNYQSEKVFTGKHYGLVKNSFGNISLIFQQEVGYSFNNFNLSLSAGLASGYKQMNQIDTFYVTFNGEVKAIEVERKTLISSLPPILKNNGIIPTVMVTLSYTKHRVQPTINVSPTFINGGLIINLD